MDALLRGIGDGGINRGGGPLTVPTSANIIVRTSSDGIIRYICHGLCEIYTSSDEKSYAILKGISQ